MEWSKKKEKGVEGKKDGMREEKKKKKKEWEKKKRGVCEVENQSDDNSPPWTEGLS